MTISPIDCSGQSVLNYSLTCFSVIFQGKDCCSPRSVTFQGTDKDHIYFYHYLLYSLHVQRQPGKLGNIKSSKFLPSEQVISCSIKAHLHFVFSESLYIQIIYVEWFRSNLPSYYLAQLVAKDNNTSGFIIYTCSLVENNGCGGLMILFC